MKMKWKGILFAVVIAVYSCHITNAQAPDMHSEDTDSFPNYGGREEGTEEEMQPIPTTTESAAEAPTTTTTEDAGFDECWSSSECGVNEGCSPIQGVRKCVCKAGYMRGDTLHGDCEALVPSTEAPATTEVPSTTSTTTTTKDTVKCEDNEFTNCHVLAQNGICNDGELNKLCLVTCGLCATLSLIPATTTRDPTIVTRMPATTTTAEEAPEVPVPLPTTTTIKHAAFMKEIMEVVNKYYIPRPFTHYRGYEYIYKKQRMTFNQAKNYCARKGGHVAYVNMKTQNQRKKIFKMFPGITNNPTWVGALFLHRMWFYINFQPVNHATFGWNKGEPNNLRRENCVANHRSGKVNNTYCNFKRAVLCEVKI